MLSVLTRPQSQYAWAIFLAVGTVPEQRQLDSGDEHTATPPRTWSHRVAFRAAGRANAAGGSRREQRSRRSVERKPGPTCQTGEVEALLINVAWYILANRAVFQIGGSGHRATPPPSPPTIDGIPESPHDGLLFPHAFLGLLSMWVLTVAWTVQNGSGSGRVWTVYGPGAP